MGAGAAVGRGMHTCPGANASRSSRTSAAARTGQMGWGGGGGSLCTPILRHPTGSTVYGGVFPAGHTHSEAGEQ